MSAPEQLSPPVPTYKYTPSTSIESYPKYRNYAPYTPKWSPHQKQALQEVLIFSYIPVPKSKKKVTPTVAPTSPQPQYENEEFVYYKDGGESKTFEYLLTEPPQQKSTIVSQSLSTGYNDGLNIQENNSSSQDVHI